MIEETQAQLPVELRLDFLFEAVGTLPIRCWRRPKSIHTPSAIDPTHQAKWAPLRLVIVFNRLLLVLVYEVACLEVGGMMGVGTEVVRMEGMGRMGRYARHRLVLRLGQGGME